MIDDTYNGWTNYETWNVALWIGNDEGLYHFAKAYNYRGYRRFAEAILEFSQETPDGVAWDAPELDTDELDEMLEEL